MGAVAQGLGGSIAEALVNAQFSQKQELAADEFGFEFSVAMGYSPYSMANSLEKLKTLSEGTQASKVSQMFSSHPDNVKRAERARAMADQYTKNNKCSFFNII